MGRVVRIRLTDQGARPGELALETEDFWTDVTVEQLREERGIEPVDDPDALGANDLTDEEADELLAALGT